MNNQARFCKLKCKYNIQGICYSYGECIAKDLFIEELEDIKAEIIGNDSDLIPPAYEQAIKDHLEIIDNRISELKGENNET